LRFKRIVSSHTPAAARTEWAAFYMSYKALKKVIKLVDIESGDAAKIQAQKTTFFFRVERELEKVRFMHYQTATYYSYPDCRSHSVPCTPSRMSLQNRGANWDQSCFVPLLSGQLLLFAKRERAEGQITIAFGEEGCVFGQGEQEPRILDHASRRLFAFSG
jgi:hypothetical protein